MTTQFLRHRGGFGAPAAAASAPAERIVGWLHDLSIERKLMLAIFAAGALTMIFAGLLFYLLLTTGLRNSFAHDIEAVARILAVNCGDGVSAGDQVTVTDMLAAMTDQERIHGAAVVMEGDRPFAMVGDIPSRWQIMLDRADTRWPSRDEMVALRPVLYQGRQLATVVVHGDFGPMHRQFLRDYALVFLLVLAGSAVASYALTNRARQMITHPLRELVRTTELVGRTQNFGLRARRLTGGEIGQLTDAFNDMLQRLKVGEAVAKEVQERRKVEAALRASEERFRTVFDNATVGLFRANREGALLMANRALIKLAGCESFAELAGWQLGGNLYADPERHRHILECLEQIGMVAETELEWRRKDNTLITVRFSAMAIRDATGTIQHFEGSVEDISARKAAEAELQRLHRELVDASRLAGMAEVATGVLHNVGNVLNSVNVSVTLLHEQLADSKLSSLARAAELLEQNADRLDTFLTEDERGRRIPGYLGKLSQHLAAERARWQEEVRRLKQNVEHIKDVVAMQQSHARVAGLVEPLAPQGLLEDAVRMNAGLLERDAVHIERDYAPTPPVLADRHKVLQILINLIRNAQHAMSDLPAGQRRLDLKVYLNGTGRVKLQVRDNGIGIAPENMTRIFAHGFTTKKDGHGFGLHSGALAARELGGALTAESDGPGRGATFTLELPVAGVNR
jgi:PAS domain S-box-containing protein